MVVVPVKRPSWLYVGSAVAALAVATGCNAHRPAPGVVDGVVRGYGGPLTFVNGSPSPVLSGQPMANQEVSALRDGSRVAVTTTGSDGQFSLRLPTGAYTILVSVCDLQESVTVRASQSQSLDLACGFP